MLPTFRPVNLFFVPLLITNHYFVLEVSKIGTWALIRTDLVRRSPSLLFSSHGSVFTLPSYPLFCLPALHTCLVRQTHHLVCSWGPVENRMSTRHTRGAAKLVEDPWAVGGAAKNNGNSKRAMCECFANFNYGLWSA